MVWVALRALPRDIIDFHNRLRVLPFQTAFAMLSVWSGVGAFFDETFVARLFNDALPQPLAVTFNIIYVVAGFSLIAGVGWAYRNLEAFGLCLLLGVLVVRSAAVFQAFGYSPATSGALIQAGIFGVAVLLRLYTLLKGWSVVLVKNTRVIATVQEVKDGL